MRNERVFDVSVILGYLGLLQLRKLFNLEQLENKLTYEVLKSRL